MSGTFQSGLLIIIFFGPGSDPPVARDTRGTSRDHRGTGQLSAWSGRLSFLFKLVVYGPLQADREVDISVAKIRPPLPRGAAPTDTCQEGLGHGTLAVSAAVRRPAASEVSLYAGHMADYVEKASPTFRSRLSKSLIMGVAGGVLTLVDPATLRPRTRAGIYLAGGAGVAAVGWFATSPREGFTPGKVFRGSVALGLAALNTAGTKFGFVVDAKIHHSLVRRGIKNPRPLMAIGSGILLAAMELMESPSKNEVGTNIIGDEFAKAPERELTSEVRDLVAGLLETTDEFGSSVLREQLTQAKEQYWGDDGEFSSELSFVVPEESARALPRNYTFPVHADFSSADGTPLRISLMIYEGQLGALVLDVAHELMEAAHTGDTDPFDSVTRWPLRSEVDYALEG